MAEADRIDPTFSPGTRLGDYELLLELARGGVATAIVARRCAGEREGQLVVVKRVHRALLSYVQFTVMLRDEAQIAGSVHHPNVASVIDVIESGAELCLVMEYFEALSLSAVVLAAGPALRPSPAVVSRIVCDALAGLHAAHVARDREGKSLGIVHRDVSPQNIIVGTDGVTRVIDFGIAKAASRLTQTKSGTVKGKVAYMSPEQVEAHPLDARADVFAAGVVLHEALTGQPLFHGGNDFAVMKRVLKGAVPPPSSLAPRIPPNLDAVTLQAVARSFAYRFASAEAFRNALEHAMPPAPPAAVAQWVVAAAGATLEQRRCELARMATSGPGRPR
jgi:serine/threonine-protein kinase